LTVTVPVYREQAVPERGVVVSCDPFSPCDAMLGAVYAVVMCPSVCVCVCVGHTPVLYQNG